VYTAVETAAAILAALFDRERTGRGQWVDVAMAETMLYVNEHLHDELWDGDDDPNWVRSFRPGDYLVLVLASGESVVVSGHPAERGTFDRFTAAMDRADLADDPRFVDVASRLRHLDDLNAEIRTYAAGVDDAAVFEERFAEFDLAVGLMRSGRELADTEWAIERGATVEVSDRGSGTIRVPNSPWRFSAGPEVGVTGIPKYRGEDNREVLGDLLDLDDEQLDALEADGIISSRLPR
jgi:crotonobetainyl-CoA:carnitine CoA-transferase CaiB-like acyl-CoA transferase